MSNKKSDSGNGNVKAGQKPGEQVTVPGVLDAETAKPAEEQAKAATVEHVSKDPDVPVWENVPTDKKRAMFEAYDAANESHKNAERALEAAASARSDAVRIIYEAAGKSGPFAWKGKSLTIAKRGDSYYFRNMTPPKPEDIG